MITCTPLVIRRHRMLLAARAVEEFDHREDKAYPARIYMHAYRKPCGTPACILGHYALRPDLQDEFTLEGSYLIWLKGSRPVRGTSLTTVQGTSVTNYHQDSVLRHFGITLAEAEEVFGSEGCGIARNPGQTVAVEAMRVANYVRRFVERKWPLPPL